MIARSITLCCFAGLLLRAQEAQSGFELRATLSALALTSDELTHDPRSGVPGTAGFRSVLYPALKIDEHWSVSGAYQLLSRPYFSESFETQGYGVKGSVLQATLNYSRVKRNRSLLLRAGKLPSAFGSFLLHYDDAANAFVDQPMQYGYYYATVSDLPVTGVQLDVANSKWDGRLQLANSSPANPRSIFSHDQYGNWTGGAGYTIKQGFRVGGSAYHGPYLDRQSPYYFPGEAPPRKLPASGLGLEVQWARGQWSTQAEIQKFRMPYRAIPTFRQHAGYFEVKRVLSPKWYLASRIGYLNASAGGNSQSIETVAGFHLNASQTVKIDYEARRATEGEYRHQNTLAVQLVSTVRPFSFGWK